MWLSLLIANAWPCAGLVHQAGLSAESDRAQVVFEVGASDVQVTYRVTYSGDAEDFGWIIPVPDEVLQVSDGDIDLFDELNDLTTPRVAYPDGAAAGASCTCVGASKGDNELRSGGGDVQVAQGFTGTYDWSAVQSGDTEAIELWLTDHGYEPPAQADLDHYVGLGFGFLILTVSPNRAETPDEGRDLPPVAIRYAGTDVRFPSVMARNASEPEQRTTVWVVAETSAAVVEGWTHVDLTSIVGPAEADPTELLNDELAELGAAKSWARTWTSDELMGFVTRFDTLAPASVHDADAVFGLEETEAEEMVLRIELVESGGAALVWLPLLGLGIGLRRRR